jgi:hypothetical protein
MRRPAIRRMAVPFSAPKRSRQELPGGACFAGRRSDASEERSFTRCRGFRMTAKDEGKRHVNCGLTLRAGGCDDYAACDDEQSADENCQRWNLFECQPRDSLSGEKEKHHVEAEQFAEVPGRRVDSPSVCEQDERRECKQRGLLPEQSLVKSCPDECVSASFQQCGEEQNKKPRKIGRLHSLRKKWSGCQPERSDGSAFRANVKEKADPSGKRRLRDDNLSVFPQAVQPLKYRFWSSRPGSMAAATFTYFFSCASWLSTSVPVTYTATSGRRSIDTRAACPYLKM